MAATLAAGWVGAALLIIAILVTCTFTIKGTLGALPAKPITRHLHKAHYSHSSVPPCSCRTDLKAH